nr:MAG TPA: hypothetical protein [Caudoviricetes sp.]
MLIDFDKSISSSSLLAQNIAVALEDKVYLSESVNLVSLSLIFIVSPKICSKNSSKCARV